MKNICFQNHFLLDSPDGFYHLEYTIEHANDWAFSFAPSALRKTRSPIIAAHGELLLQHYVLAIKYSLATVALIARLQSYFFVLTILTDIAQLN